MEAFFTSFEGKITLWIILAGSISLHEWGHAYSADKLGDPLPRSQGRVTLNPLAHLDPIGTVLIPLVMILFSPSIALLGWGKPVYVSLPNPKTRVRDDLITTACGPLVNLVIALVAAIIGGILLRMESTAVMICIAAVQMNVALFTFNMLPIPPLDGSHFMRRAIGMSDEAYMKFSSYGFIILIVMINMKPVMGLLYGLIQLLASPFYQIMSIVAGQG